MLAKSHASAALLAELLLIVAAVIFVGNAQSQSHLNSSFTNQTEVFLQKTTPGQLRKYQSMYVSEKQKYQMENRFVNKYKDLYRKFQRKYEQTRDRRYLDLYYELYSLYWHHHVNARQLKKQYKYYHAVYTSLELEHQIRRKLTARVCQLADEQLEEFNENLQLFMKENRHVMANSIVDDHKVLKEEELLKKFKGNEKLQKRYKQLCDDLKAQKLGHSVIGIWF